MVSNFYYSLSLLTLSLILLNPQVNAEWGEEEEAPSTGAIKKVYKVHRDGTWEYELDLQQTILTEDARNHLSMYSFYYYPCESKIEILEASINNGDEKFTVPQEKIKDEPKESTSQCLSGAHKITIPFDRMSVGSLLHIKMKHSSFNLPFKEYFFTLEKFKGDCLWKQANIEIESELPLFLKINDPRNKLDISKGEDESGCTVGIKLKEPLFEKLVREPVESHGPLSLYTTVSISTEKDYERLGKRLAEFYQFNLDGSLPEQLKAIYLDAKTVENENEVKYLNTIVTLLHKKIMYRTMEDCETRKHRFMPRPLDTIMKSGWGNCKDYASCFAAIVNQPNKFGFQANISYVKSKLAYAEKERLPSVNEFNHAIARVMGSSSQTYWIDPTHDIAMADGIFSHIADRPTLVLDSKNPTYERIPPINPTHATTTIKETITITNKEYVGVEGVIEKTGESAILWIDYLSKTPPADKALREGILNQLCVSSEPLNPVVTFSKVVGREVKPVKATLSFGDDGILTRTNTGQCFPLGGRCHHPYQEASQKNEGDLYVGQQETISHIRFFPNKAATGLENLNSEIDNDCVKASRKAEQTEEGVRITDRFERRMSIIPAEEIKSDKFKEFQKALREKWNNVAIVFDSIVLKKE